MTRSTSIICSLIVGGALVVGCDKNDNKPADNTTAPGGNMSSGSGGAMSSGGNMSSGGGAMSSGGNMSSGGAMSSGEGRMGATTQPSGGGLMSDSPTTRPSGASSDASSQAQEWLDKAVQYVKENKYDLADQALAKVEAMKDQLPPAMQTQLASARNMLQGARAKDAVTNGAQGLGIPNLGGSTEANK